MEDPSPKYECRTEAATILFLAMDSKWDTHVKKTLSSFADIYLKPLLKRDVICLNACKIPSVLWGPPGCSDLRYGEYGGRLEESVLSAIVEGNMGFESLKCILSNGSYGWTFEDLSGRDLWYVAILAHVDQAFRDALSAYVRSFRSAILPHGSSSLEDLLDSVLDIKKIVSEVEGTTIAQRSLFIGTLARKGTRAMIEPFLKASICLD